MSDLPIDPPARPQWKLVATVQPGVFTYAPEPFTAPLPVQRDEINDVAQRLLADLNPPSWPPGDGSHAWLVRLWLLAEAYDVRHYKAELVISGLSLPTVTGPTVSSPHGPIAAIKSLIVMCHQDGSLPWRKPVERVPVDWRCPRCGQRMAVAAARRPAHADRHGEWCSGIGPAQPPRDAELIGDVLCALAGATDLEPVVEAAPAPAPDAAQVGDAASPVGLLPRRMGRAELEWWYSQGPAGDYCVPAELARLQLRPGDAIPWAVTASRIQAAQTRLLLTEAGDYLAQRGAP